MEQHGILIIGGGNAGVSLAARLLRDGATDVSVVEGQAVHRYRPLLNYVGAGQATMKRLERPMAAVMPPRCTWIRDEVVEVDAAASVVHTRSGRALGYATLVVCPGMTEAWEATPGLREAYDAGWAGSTFVPSSAPAVWPALQGARGTVVFTVPPEPSPCGATALKPLFMACDHWQRAGVLDQLRVVLVLPRQVVTGLRPADKRLDAALDAYGVEVLRDAQVTQVDATAQQVTVSTAGGPARTLDEVAYAHVVPDYRAPGWVASSGLSDGSPSRVVDIDPQTLRHRRHPAVWSIGDAAAVATPPSGGALRKQVDVLAHNIRATATGEQLRSYDGYTVMPITLTRRSLMLVEVDRDKVPSPSIPFVDLTKPRRTTWWFDRYALPVTYYRRILRGKV